MTNKPMNKYSFFSVVNCLGTPTLFFICKRPIYHNDIDLLSDIKIASIFYNLAFILNLFIMKIILNFYVINIFFFNENNITVLILFSLTTLLNF